MAPPELPKTSLALGTTKAKKKKKLAFRPGQRAAKTVPKKKVAPAPAATPKEKAPEPAKKKPDFSAEEEEFLETPETNLTNDDEDDVVEEDSLPEKTGKSPVEKEKDTAKKSTSPKLASALKNPKTSPTKIIGTTSTKSKPSSTTVSPSKAKAAARKTVEPGASSPTKTTKASAATTKTKAGRKRKSTGLVIGASITTAKRKTRQEEEEPAAEQQQQQPEPAEQVVAPALAFPMPADMPPPLEGEVTLGTLCSSFKGVPLREPEQPAHRNNRQQRNRDNNNNQDNHNNPPAPVVVAPEVQIINGEIVLQENSLVVEDRAGATMGRAGGAVVDEGEYDVVEEDAHADMTTVQAGYQDFTTRTKSKNWTADETKLFFEILRQVGTDFGLMAEFFEGRRNRKQLKRKYRQELTRNPKLVDKALHPAQQKPLDLTVFEITKDQVQEQVEAAKKKEQEEIAAREGEAEEAKKKKAEEEANKENGMDVVEEDDEVEDLFAAMMQKPKEKSAYELEVEALKPMEEAEDSVPLWPDEEEGEEPVEEEDPMMMEDFENFGEHDDGGEDYLDTSALETEPVEEDKTDEPALSLLPAGNKKKKKSKFRSTLTGRKKK